MTFVQVFRGLLLVTLCVAGCVGTIGCATFTSPNPVSVDAAAAPAGTYAVEFYSENSKPERIQLPLTDAMLASEALNAAKAHKRFGKMQVKLIRKSAETGHLVPMDIDYDGRKQRVAPEFDYAVQPGDRFVVIEDDATILDQIIGPVEHALGH